MDLIAARCPNCSGEIKLDPSNETGFCMHCGSKIVVEEAIEKIKVEGIATDDSILNVAREALKYGKYEEAYNYFNKCYLIDPNNYEYIAGRTVCLGFLAQVQLLFQENDINNIRDLSKHPLNNKNYTSLLPLMVREHLSDFFIGMHNLLKENTNNHHDERMVKASENLNNYALGLFDMILEGRLLHLRDKYFFDRIIYFDDADCLIDELKLLCRVIFILYILDVALSCNPKSYAIMQNISTICNVYESRKAKAKVSPKWNRNYILGQLSDMQSILEREIPSFEITGFLLSNYMPSEVNDRVQSKMINDGSLVKEENASINILEGNREIVASFKEKKKSGCYIATAVYNDSNAPQVILLRQYRDQVLLNTITGRMFVKFYYRVSPSIAIWLNNKNRINAFIRSWLDIFIRTIRKHHTL